MPDRTPIPSERSAGSCSWIRSERFIEESLLANAHRTPWTPIAMSLASLPDTFDVKEAVKAQQEAMGAARELTRVDLQRTLATILKSDSVKVASSEHVIPS
jgi:hypothetical protein